MEENTQKLSRVTAARWYTRLRAHDCTSSERAEFEKWLCASPDNIEAYRKAESVASLVSASAKQDVRFVALAKAALETPKASAVGHWRVAAVLMVGVALALVGLANIGRFNDAGLMVTHQNSTRQQQRYVLQDGSVMVLDVDSQVSVHMDKAQRSVNLLAGRAYFEVVHDKNRSFEVNAGELRTTDLGTRFQVAMTEAHDISVTLVEGVVQVSDSKDTKRWQQAMSPGEQVLLKSGAMTLERQSVDVAALTSWSTGRLIFKGTPLQTALDEVNRYSNCKIHLGDANLASIPIGGNFIAGGDSTQVIDALAAVLPLRVVHVGANEIVLFQRN